MDLKKILEEEARRKDVKRQELLEEMQRQDQTVVAKDATV